MKKAKELIQPILVFLSTYLLLSLVNWSFNTSLWGGGSVFLLGLVGFIIIFTEL